MIFFQIFNIFFDIFFSRHGSGISAMRPRRAIYRPNEQKKK